MNDILKEIESYCFSTLSYKEKYTRLYRLLDRVCKQLTTNEPTDFSNLFARLFFLCTKYHIKSQAIEVFRIHAKQVMQSETFPYTHEDYLYDVKALCETISILLQTPITKRLQELLPTHWRALPEAPYQSDKKKRIRMVVEHWDDSFIYGFDEAIPGEQPLQVAFHEAFPELKEILFEGAQLNLLSVTSDEAGILQAELMVFEPDYLIDISALSRCLTNYGNTPLNYLLGKFESSSCSIPILLGNAANQFLDDCVNESTDKPITFNESIQKAFRTDLLAYCCTPQIDCNYFSKAKEQFEHIRTTVNTLFHTPSYQFDRDKVLLEPSFLCECMGLQGRMDMLQSNGKNLIELKSGKANNWGGIMKAKSDHALQMALYKEVLFYNLDIPREEVHSYLFYSLYPKLYAERSSKGQIQQAMSLRNSIVANEIRLKNEEGEALILSLTTDSFNINNDHSILWNNYQRPRIEKWLNTLQRATSLEKAYFFQFLAFIEKEQFLSKIGNAMLDSSNGFASIWNSDLTTKQESGNIFTDLTISRLVDNKEGNDEGIERLYLEVPIYNEGFLPNFRNGDIILFYERNKESDNVTNRQVFRCNIESISNTELVIKLHNKQRNRQVFNLKSRYAIEHDFMDSSYNTIYKGLFSFLVAPTERKELILCQRNPRTNPNLSLSKHYLNEQIDSIVLQAKQAEDYFLLVGPPGTGKTSVALKSMVEEFYTDSNNQLLLLSYTNRAVDEICDMLEQIEGQPTYVRIGSELSCDERFQPRLIKNITKTCCNRDEIVRTLNQIRIVVGTTSSIAGKPELFQLKHFQVAIIDEASQILEPQILGILCACNADQQCAIDKFILIGDPKQLPAVVQQTPEESTVTNPLLLNIGLTDRRNSLFERIYHWLHTYPQPGILSMLQRQGRMHPEVNDFSNQFFYGGVLDIVPVKHQIEPLEFSVYPAKGISAEALNALYQPYLQDALHELPRLIGQYKLLPYMQLLASTRVAFIPSKFPPLEDSNKINRHEADIVASLVLSIYHLCLLNELPFQAAKRIGIIVPFRNQIALIKKALKELHIPETEEITIDTVERYQGSQRDIILFSATISQMYQLDILSAPVKVDGVEIDRKLNVALTRAKKQLFVIGNANILRHNPIYKEFIQRYLIKEPFLNIS